MLKFMTARAIPAPGTATSAAPQTISRWVAAATAPWVRLARDIARRQRQRQWRRELHLLDEHACRDLGLDRSELDSYEAEAAGAAVCSRRRVPTGYRAADGPEWVPVCSVRTISHGGSHDPGVLSGLHFNTTETVMPKFVIERAIPGIGASTAGELQAASQKSCGVLRELGPDVQWVHSYVTNDKIYCIYNAASAEHAREHARRAGFPADSVVQVVTIIDPTTAEA